MIDNSGVGFDPTRSNAIVRDVEVGDKNDSEIETPNSSDPHNSLSTDSRVVGAVVMSTGPDLESCEKGDMVLYISKEAYEIDDEGTKIIEESAILAIGANLKGK